MKKIIIICSIVALASCSAVDTIKMTASHVVNSYCSNPESARHLIRMDLDEALAPHSIKVTCVE
jgi:hypothetical protein